MLIEAGIIGLVLARSYADWLGFLQVIGPSSSLRNLGVLFEADLSLASRVNQLTARCYSSLRRIKSCRHALTRSASVTLVNSVIVSRLDYCNSLLAGCSKQLVDKLQRVLNCAARLRE